MQNITEKLLNYGPEITWPKEFPELKLIDDALRCGICYDYIKTCMVTPCAHSYCSICIRRSLLYKTACPTCFEETYETSLRNNRVLDRVTELFSSIKERIVKHLKIAAVHFNCNDQMFAPVTPQSQLKANKVNQDTTTPIRNSQKPNKKSSSKGKLLFVPKSEISSSSKSSGRSDISKRLEDILGSPATQNSSGSEVSFEVSNGNDSPRGPSVPPMFLQTKTEVQPKCSNVPSVPCPVCGVSIPERNINIHLDNCLTNADKPPSPVKARPKRNPLPKMVWSLMAEKDLRKKLKEYGLNTQGDKKVLISRIQRYILLYNSECDSDNPRPVSEIIRQLEKEEKQTPAQSHQRLFAMNGKCDPKIVEEENKKYIEENKSSFKKLIEAMKDREGRNIKPVSYTSHRVLSDDEDEILKTMKASAEVPSTSKHANSIDLCGSNDSDTDSSFLCSPVLKGTSFTDKKLSNIYDSDSSASDSTPNSVILRDKNFSKVNESRRNLDELCSMLNDDSSSNASHINTQRLPRSPSPLAADNSDSENSFSLLNNAGSGEDMLDNSSEPNTECVPDIDSQLEDPDFVFDTNETENNSEEVFIPQRRSKRKFQNTVQTDSKQNLSPRRTRRRVSK